MQESKMEGAEMDADIRQPSINTEPRTLNESTFERALVAAQTIYAENPDPTSDCFTKDATDTATRENSPTAKDAPKENAPAKDAPANDAPAEDVPAADALGTQIDVLVQKAGSLVDSKFAQPKAPLSTETPAAPPSQP